ncbi:hypothetical protein GLOTRDRAFT_139485 [Gloeophyllum trabeum ATCC 11539]|uniref:Uncharacterized protein n=1 Tax=Gloeophyllum trabeum (strain ATCC 11539 / FP-39264 / Madison 617) TaxID=670483 RepID=S7Q3S8_GLOTA|nr:uncharacterized protein GLOTRDRAFT_139485 [Gloeophyllum trabeum ATCC 11539]EPQ54088.1 hypothetical protein GLOTRDRAFT_139485 [Gloeophyllum trabeum ATCC 11539]
MSNGYKPRDNVESDEEYVSEGAKAWLKRQRSKLSSTNGRSQPSQSKADAPPTTTSVKTASQPKSPRKQASKRKRKALGEDAAAAPPSKRVRRQEDSEEFDELDDEEDIPLSKLSQLLKNSAHTGNAPVSKGEKVTIDLTDEVDDEMKPDPDDPLGPIKWFLKCSDLPVRKFLNGLVKGGVTSGQALHQLVRLPASYQDDFLKSIMVGGGWTFLEVQLIKQALCNAQAGTGSLKMKSF